MVKRSPSPPPSFPGEGVAFTGLIRFERWLGGEDKAAVNSPQSRGFAINQRVRMQRSVWTAVASAPLSCGRDCNFDFRILTPFHLVLPLTEGEGERDTNFFPLANR